MIWDGARTHDLLGMSLSTLSLHRRQRHRIPQSTTRLSFPIDSATVGAFGRFCHASSIVPLHHHVFPSLHRHGALLGDKEAVTRIDPCLTSKTSPATTLRAVASDSRDDRDMQVLRVIAVSSEPS